MRNITLKLALCGLIASTTAHTEPSLWTRLSDNSIALVGSLCLAGCAALYLNANYYRFKHRKSILQLKKERTEILEKRTLLLSDIAKITKNRKEMSLVPDDFIPRIDAASYTPKEQAALKKCIGNWNLAAERYNTNESLPAEHGDKRPVQECRNACASAKQRILNFIKNTSALCHSDITQYKQAENREILAVYLGVATLFGMAYAANEKYLAQNSHLA